MSIASQKPISYSPVEEEKVEEKMESVQIKQRELGWKKRSKHQKPKNSKKGKSKKGKKTKRKRKRRRQKPEENRREKNMVDSQPVKSPVKDTSRKWTKPVTSVGGQSKVTMGYGVLALLLCGGLSCFAQDIPRTTVIRQPARLGGRVNIVCTLGSDSPSCHQMYWALNGTVVRDRQEYSMTFLQEHCLGYLTFRANTAHRDVGIQCLMEFDYGNGTRKNYTSKPPVTIRLPNEGLTGTETGTNTTEGGYMMEADPGSSSGSTGSGSGRTGSGSGSTGSGEKDDSAMENVGGDDGSGRRLDRNVAAIASSVVVVVLVLIIIGGIVVVMCCVRKKNPTETDEITDANQDRDDKVPEQIETATQASDDQYQVTIVSGVSGSHAVKMMNGSTGSEGEDDRKKFTAPVSRVGLTSADLPANREKPPSREYQRRRGNHRSSPQKPVERELQKMQEKSDPLNSCPGSRPVVHSVSSESCNIELSQPQSEGSSIRNFQVTTQPAEL